jgi:hypothetical protein
MDVDINQKSTKVYNPFLNKEIYTITPWQTIENKYYNATQWYPNICQLSLKDDDYNFSCSSQHFNSARVLFGAGGTAYTWINTNKTFTQNGTSFMHTYTGKDMPVLDKYGEPTGFTLNEYSYSMYDVFSGYYTSWWSNISLIPVYPNIPESTSKLQIE